MKNQQLALWLFTRNKTIRVWGKKTFQVKGKWNQNQKRPRSSLILFEIQRASFNLHTYSLSIRDNNFCHRPDLFLATFISMSRFHVFSLTSSRHQSPKGGNEWTIEKVGMKLRFDCGRDWPINSRVFSLL